VSGIDWGAVATWGLSGLAFGTLFALVCYIAARALMFEVLASPVVQAIGRGAATIAAKFGGKGAVDWKTAVAQGGMKLLTKWFGGEE